MYADEFGRVFETCLTMIREREKTAPAEARAMRESFELLLRGCLQIHLSRVTVRQAAKLTDRSPSQIRRWIREGKLRARPGHDDRLTILTAELPIMSEQRMKLTAIFKHYLEELEKA